MSPRIPSGIFPGVSTFIVDTRTYFLENYDAFDAVFSGPVHFGPTRNHWWLRPPQQLTVTDLNSSDGYFQAIAGCTKQGDERAPALIISRVSCPYQGAVVELQINDERARIFAGGDLIAGRQFGPAVEIAQAARCRVTITGLYPDRNDVAFTDHTPTVVFGGWLRKAAP